MGPPISRRLLHWQYITVALLVTGYAGYYFCRSNLSVSITMIEDEFVSLGWDRNDAKVALGDMVSWGVLVYAFGKFISGGIGDFLGGRRNFLCGMGGAVFFTILFALGGGLPIFTIAWIGNRLVQSMGWVGMVKISSRWFPYSAYGTVMGVISLSFLFGDALAKSFMGVLIGWGVGWRGLFFVCAGILSGLLLINFLWLKETPRDIGESEPDANPQNVFGKEGNQSAPFNPLAAPVTPFSESSILVGLSAFAWIHPGSRDL